ncbi:MAG TPA: NAD-dependent epimerase/dehydratase family protein [Candidatus Aminicenantes bacterium]|nr:NAD-dependent epimerase/dehydratase family protein [Candidatus Aminicenantes bacterium]HRY65664.1 NAD-dependent epimerase/dehydratase family protein [Candidatus Aminicenantes bacterium]HRZ72448.1 NAD-dependent epimerase/dehydratase family protein [Candidatus Aminicenantes bacterium]
MKILVTGATGFVGAVLMPELVRRYGAGAVDAFVLPGDSVPGSWREAGVRLIPGDIADPAAVTAAVRGHDRVVHMAGLISYWKGDEARLKAVNEDGVRAVVEASLAAGVERLVHISSVGAAGFHEDGTPADETAPFNWPPDILYMASKRRGQDIVERAVRSRGLRAVILNPASIMGPGDHNPATPHNRLYKMISGGPQIGSFAGGLAIVDVRDLASVILKAVEGRGRDGESYLVVGANLTYPEVVRRIGRACGRRAYPFRVPGPLFTAAGGFLELAARVTGKRPLITAAYGRLSGWTAYYDNAKSRREFGQDYIDADKTIADGWAYYRDNFLNGRA